DRRPQAKYQNLAHISKRNLQFRRKLVVNVQGKTIVVTGAGGGLGSAVAQSLASAGARLALVDINETALRDIQSACDKLGAEARIYAVDVTDEKAIENLFDDIARDFGRVDGLVNNAGVTRDGLLVKARDGKVISKMSAKDWDTVLTLDLRSGFLCAREAAVKMVEQGAAKSSEDPAGVIINISSISRAGNLGQTNYSAAKAGVAAMTTTWAGELARHGIRVAAIAPGFCNTQMVANIKEDMLAKLKSNIPLGRLGSPEEIGHTVRFILENEFVTGRVLEVDGGMRL